LPLLAIADMRESIMDDNKDILSVKTEDITENRVKIS
jgi:hypothetical protein